MKKDLFISLSPTSFHALRMCILFVCTLMNVSSAIGQSEVSASGGDGSGSGGTVAFTVGQVSYTNIQAEDGSISLGVQQPNLFLTVGTHDEEISISATVFPNPANTTTSLQLEGVDIASWGDDLSYRLYDLNGKLIEEKPIESSITSIPMHHLVSDVYFLQVTRKDIEIKSFKIFKTN